MAAGVNFHGMTIVGVQCTCVCMKCGCLIVSYSWPLAAAAVSPPVNHVYDVFDRIQHSDWSSVTDTLNTLAMTHNVKH